MLDHAESVATVAHAGLYDKAGKPSILHPAYVAGLVGDATGDSELVAAAWLHDVVEDTYITIGALRVLGFSERTLSIVDAVTRKDGETYSEFIDQIVDRDAAIVKMADILHNTSAERSGSLSKSLAVRYEKALRVLTERFPAEAAALGVLNREEEA